MWNTSLKAIFLGLGYMLTKSSQRTLLPRWLLTVNMLFAPPHAPLALQNASDVLQQVAWTSLGPHVATRQPASNWQSITQHRAATSRARCKYLMKCVCVLHVWPLELEPRRLKLAPTFTKVFIRALAYSLLAWSAVGKVLWTLKWSSLPESPDTDAHCIMHFFLQGLAGSSEEKREGVTHWCIIRTGCQTGNMAIFPSDHSKKCSKNKNPIQFSPLIAIQT